MTTIPQVIKSPADLQTCKFTSWHAGILRSFQVFFEAAKYLITNNGQHKLTFSGLSTLPLNGVASMLTTLDCKEAGIEPGAKGAQGMDAAGYESVSLPLAIQGAGIVN